MTADAVEITIRGRVAVKKNSRRARRNWRTGASFSVPSEAFERFKDDVMDQFRKNKLFDLQILPPYGMSYKFFMKGKAGSDFDNMEASINDILQEAGIIEDDKLIVHTTDNWKVGGCQEYYSKIKIWHIEKNTILKG